ncbi:MAG: hybrid sensor histidine kinase/response regulator [Pseudomonadota bacterium]
MRKLLRLDEDRVLVEQLRLLLGNVRSTVLPSLLITGALLWTLSNDSNALGMKLWAAAIIALKLYAAHHAHHYLCTGISTAQAPRLVWILLGLNAVYGAAWGALAWVTLDTITLVESIFVLAVLAGIVGSSMAALSPVLPVFVVFVVFETTALASKAWLMDDPTYRTLTLASLLFVAALIIQARSSAIAARSAINLRFENIELAVRLREETDKAQAAHQEAVQANLVKSKFLAAASHDLRQPIHALGLFLEVLARSELTAVQRDVLGNARAVSEASAEMLNTLLDFSRIEAGVVEAQIRPFHLQPLLNKIEHELAPQANAKGLFYRTRETYAAVQSDPALVELILRNLVTNAIRYTARGGLLVACRTQGNTTQLEVWDTGIGIDAAQHQNIFREFHQLGNTERDRTKGLGLGLSIVDGLARTLGHTLAVSSRPGYGSVFRLGLPKAQMAVVHEELDAMPVSMRKLNMRVLVVDDDEAVRAGMLQLLLSWGCQCEAVESITDALHSARAHRPDMVISDYRLREQRTGAEAIAALRAELGDALPALLITGDTAPERLRDARASGIPLLHKPVAPTQLYRRLVDVLREHRAPVPVQV